MTMTTIPLISDNAAHEDLIVPTQLIPATGASIVPLNNSLAALYISSVSERRSLDVSISVDATSPTPSVSRASPQVRGLVSEWQLLGTEPNVLNLKKKIADLSIQMIDTRLLGLDILSDQLEAVQESLEDAKLVQAVETYDRVLQAINDQLVRQLSESQRQVLRGCGLDYIFDLLNPQQLREEYTPLEVDTRDAALTIMGDLTRTAAEALLTELRRLKAGPRGWNAIQHPPPTQDEATEDIRRIEHLSRSQESRLIDIIASDPQSLEGEALFLPNDHDSKVRKLRRRVADLEAFIRRSEARLASQLDSTVRRVQEAAGGQSV